MPCNFFIYSYPEEILCRPHGYNHPPKVSSNLLTVGVVVDSIP